MWWWRRSSAAAFTPTADLFFVIAGQSNASGRGSLTASPKEKSDRRVRMFHNDYTWKTAYEPIDDAVGQVDAVSDDSANSPGHSFALRAAKGLLDPIGALTTTRVNLIPCAMGGTSFSQWARGGDPLDRATLYGSANYRRTQAVTGGDVVAAILYYGHENQWNLDSTYTTLIATLVADFRNDFGASVPFIWCALAKHTDPLINHGFHLCADKARLCEEGSGDAAAISNLHLITTFDLPLIDLIHLNEAAQRTVGDRMALAIRQHVLSEAVDGTGPRLNGAPTHPGGDKSKIKIDTTQTLATISGNADNQFRVFDGATEMTISSVANDADDSAILITMSATASGTVTVSYGDVVASGTGVTLSNVVKNATGLPLPQFAAQTAT